MKRIIFILGLCISIVSQAQTFEKFFEHKTLLIDYIFSGDHKKQEISVDGLVSYPHWAGKTQHLNHNPLRGNGSIEVKDKESQQLIYTNSFSSLFQEWLDTEEAKQTKKAFENTFLIPYPKNKVEVTLKLYNLAQEKIAEMSFIADPNDILIEKKGSENITPYRILHRGSVKNPIQVAILAEGYTAPQLGQFYVDAEKAMKSIFAHEPFKSKKEAFNFVAVGSISEDTGVSIPRQGKWRNTIFKSHFDTFYSDRYLTTRNVKAIHDALAGIPYEHIIILANTDEYGGGGIYNSYTLTTAHHEDFEAVVVHEFGHSFGGLADEYFYEQDVMSDVYPLDIEPWEANITTLKNFDAKWKAQLKPKTPVPTPITEAKRYPIGVYEGGGYSSQGIYRASHDCRMKTNTYPEFCPVCQTALLKLINFYTEDKTNK